MGLNMLKKIIFLVCTFSYANIFTMSNAKQLSQTEFSTYNKIMDQYEENKKITRAQVEQLLQSEKLSIHQLYGILQRRHSTLQNARNEFFKPTHMRPLSPSPAGVFAAAFPLLLSMGSLIIGTPLLLIGLAIQNYVAPSTMQKVASYGLMTLGGITLTPEIMLEWYREGFISQIALPQIYEMITHAEKKREKQFDKLIHEYRILEQLINNIKQIYPELTTAQPTSR
jgi:hypothetical protein